MNRSYVSTSRALAGLGAFSLTLCLAASNAHATTTETCGTKTYSFDPNAAWSTRDDDGDCIANGVDNCPYESNTDQTLGADGVHGAACQMQAITVPWVPTDPALSHVTFLDKTVTLKGMVRYGNPTPSQMQFMWDFGDGHTSLDDNNGQWYTVSDPYNLGVPHLYVGLTGQPFIAKLTVKDNGTLIKGQPEVSTANYPIQILASTSATAPLPSDPNLLDTQIAVSEDEAIWRLHTSMGRSTVPPPGNDGNPWYAQPYGDWENQSATCAALDVFQLHGSKPASHGPGLYDTDPYVEDAQRAINYMLANAHYYPSLPTKYGLNGAFSPGAHGINFTGDDTYTDGICGIGFASSGEKAAVAMTGPAGVYNDTYVDIMQNVVNWFANSQTDARYNEAYWGGWHYSSGYTDADGSTNQWPIMTWATGFDNYGVSPPQDAINLIPYFLEYSHSGNPGATDIVYGEPVYGGWGYTEPNYYTNVAKTAGGMLGHFFLEDNGVAEDGGSPAPGPYSSGQTISNEILSGIGFLYTHWEHSNGFPEYNLGDSYAMYDVMKSMQKASPQITKLVDYNKTDSGDSNGTNSFDWYYTPAGQSQTGLATYILGLQQGNGSFVQTPGVYHDGSLSTTLITAWDTLILLKAVTNVPPRAAICNCSDQWSLASPVTFDGSCSIEPDQSKVLVHYYWDFSYDGKTFNATIDPATLGSLPDGGGYPYDAPVVVDTAGFNEYTEYADGGPNGNTQLVALEVFDNTGPVPESALTTCAVTIKPPPHCPNVVTGGPYLGSIGDVIHFDASQTADVDNDPLIFKWDFEDLNVFGDATGPTPVSQPYLEPGTFPIELKVTNEPDQSHGAVPSCTVVAFTTVVIGNHAPVVVPGGPYTALPGTPASPSPIQLDGSGTFDPDPGDTAGLTYAWDFGSGNYNDGNTAIVTFPNPTSNSTETVGETTNVCLRATDPHGLSGTACAVVTIIDHYSPPVCVFVPTTVQMCTGQPQTFTLDGSHSHDPNLDHFTYSWAAACPGADSIDNPSASVAHITLPSAQGGCNQTCQVTLTVTNSVGLFNTCSQMVALPDQLPPAFTTPPASASFECNASTAANVKAWLAAPTATEACVAPSNPVLVGNDFLPGTGCGGVGSTGVNGSRVVTFTGTDPCDGKTVQQTATISVADTQPPVLNLPTEGVTTEATSPNGAVVSYTVSAVDAATGPQPVHCDHASGAEYPVGPTPVTCTSTDPSGQVATGTFTVTVTDHTPPVLHLTNMVVESTEAGGGAVVNFQPAPYATDIVDVTTTVNCLPASGADLSAGPHTISCTTTDAHGNTSMGTFTVLVEDTTPPVIAGVVDGVTTTLEATGPNGVLVTDYGASASDIVDGSVPVICTPLVPMIFPLGNTKVGCTATDATGNVANLAFTIRVVDTTKPNITCPSDIAVAANGALGAVDWGTGDATSNAIAAFFAGASATDLVDLNPVLVNDAPFAFPTGQTTTVTFTATDGYNNSNSCSAQVSVSSEPSTPPSVLTCPATATLSTGSGVEVDWSSVFMHPVTVDLLVVNGGNGGTPLSLSDLSDRSVELSSTSSSAGDYAVRLRAIDQVTGFAVDCNRFISVAPSQQLGKEKPQKSLMRATVPAIPVRY